MRRRITTLAKEYGRYGYRRITAMLRAGQVLFAAGDAMGAMAGWQWMQVRNVPVSGISGALTASPLAVREAQQAIKLPVFDIEQLADPRVAATLIALPVQRKLRA